MLLRDLWSFQPLGYNYKASHGNAFIATYHCLYEVGSSALVMDAGQLLYHPVAYYLLRISYLRRSSLLHSNNTLSSKHL